MKKKKTSPFTFKPLHAVFAVFFLVVGAFFWYQSRAVPDLDEGYQVTTLPKEFQQVLGASTNLNNSAEVSLRIPILMYHYVEYVHNNPGRQNLNIPPNILIAQIETLKNDGYTFITPSDLTIALDNKTKLPDKTIMLTFDDGYMDFYTDVYPILQKEHVKGTSYIVPNFLDRPNFMFTYQLKEVAKSPLVEIGAHTMNHLWLSGMNQKQATYEIVQSRKTLQDMLGLPITSFAYPYGAFDRQAVQIVQNAGFTNTVSVVPGIVHTKETEYILYRLRPGYRTGQVLLNFLKQDTFRQW